MQKFRVNKGHDAYARYTAVIDATDAAHANELLSAGHVTGWVKSGIQEYDDFEVFADETELVDADEADEGVTVLSVTPRERDIILAALRLWQRTSTIPPELYDLAINDRPGGRFLSDNEIDVLIEEKINVGS